MKTLRRLCAVAVLTSAFALPAFADEIPCGIETPPPPPGVAFTGETTEEGGDVTADLLAALLNGLLTVL